MHSGAARVGVCTNLGRIHSGSARIGVCTNQGILCPVILDALASAPIRVEFYTTVLHVLASVPIRRQYAQWTCMSWRLYQLFGCMHSGSERLGVCTNEGCVIIPQRKEVYPQDLKRVRVSVARIRKREGEGR